METLLLRTKMRLNEFFSFIFIRDVFRNANTIAYLIALWINDWNFKNNRLSKENENNSKNLYFLKREIQQTFCGFVCLNSWKPEALWTMLNPAETTGFLKFTICFRMFLLSSKITSASLFNAVLQSDVYVLKTEFSVEWNLNSTDKYVIFGLATEFCQ